MNTEKQERHQTMTPSILLMGRIYLCYKCTL